MQKPNILIFMTDQQRGSTVFSEKIKTPSLDKFRAEGISFTNAYTTAPHCCPSRASFFSGLYPSKHGVWNNVNVGNTLSRGLFDNVELFTQDLKKSGYRTYFSGKWHVSDYEVPTDRGFDVMRVPEPVKGRPLENMPPDPYEWDRFTGFRQREKESSGEIIRKGYVPYTHYGIKDNPFNDEDVVNDSIDHIMDFKSEDSPFLMFTGTLGPHDPYYVPENFLSLYDIDDIELPESFYDQMNDKPGLYRKTAGVFRSLTEMEHKEALRHYYAFVSYEDHLFGRLMEALEKSGQKDNTLVVYLSDHGDYMADHGLWCKGLPGFSGAYHIPALIRWPKGINDPGRQIDSYISITDFAPTFLELAGIDPKRYFDGKSLLPYIENRTPSDIWDAVYTQTNGNELYGIQRTVMTKKWRFNYNGFDFDELYDLEKDPHETINLIYDTEYEPIVKDMCRKMWRFAKRTSDVCVNQYIMVGLAPYGPGVIFDDVEV